MGTCCGKDDPSASIGRRRGGGGDQKSNLSHAVEAEYDRDGHSTKHMTKQEESVTQSSPPSPPRKYDSTNNATTTGNKFQQSPHRARILTLEPVNQSEEDEFSHHNPHQQILMKKQLSSSSSSQQDVHYHFHHHNQQQEGGSSLSKNQNGNSIHNNNNDDDDDALAQHEAAEIKANFLRFVNGSQSHAVARVLLEQWCIILNAISKEDEDRKQHINSASGAVGGGTTTNGGSLLHIAGADDDLDLDGFGGGGSNKNAGGGNNNGGGGSIILPSSFMKGKEIYFNQRMFGEGVDVSHSASTTRIEKWATQHASEAVTHESTEEVVQAFLPYLREEVKHFGAGGEFQYDQQGFDVTGVVGVTIKLVRFDGEECPHTYEIVVNYHSISLL